MVYILVGAVCKNWCMRTYSMGFDIALDQLAGGGVHGHGAGAVDHAIGDNGLVVDAGEGLGGFLGEDGGLGGHFGVGG